jgi:hypothetical protein
LSLLIKKDTNMSIAEKLINSYLEASTPYSSVDPELRKLMGKKGDHIKFHYRDGKVVDGVLLENPKYVGLDDHGFKEYLTQYRSFVSIPNPPKGYPETKRIVIFMRNTSKWMAL